MPRHSPYALIRLNFLLNIFSCSLELLEFLWTFVLVFFFAVKRFDPFYVFSFRPDKTFILFLGNCSSLPKLIGKTYSNLFCLLKCVLFYLFVSTHFTSLFGFQWTFSFNQTSQRVIALLLAELTALLGSRHCRVVGSSGLEPPTSRLSGARSNHLSYEPIKLFRCISSLSPIIYGFCRWWRWWDSNPWPPACRAGALPTELHPRVSLALILTWNLSIRKNYGMDEIWFIEFVIQFSGTK